MTSFLTKPGEVHVNPPRTFSALGKAMSWRDLRDWINAMPEEQLDCEVFFLDGPDVEISELYKAVETDLVSLHNCGQQVAIVCKRY